MLASLARLLVFIYLILPTTVLLLFREPETTDIVGEQLLLPTVALVFVGVFVTQRRFGWARGVVPFVAVLIGTLKYRADTSLWRPPPDTELSGKVVVITGGNSGLGLAVSKSLAALGARVVITCRSVPKCERAVKEINGATETDGTAGGPAARYALLDLSSLKSARNLAVRLSAEYPSGIHFLFLNAGSTPRHELTEDGFEDGFGGMHLAHMAVALGLMPSLRSGGSEDRPSRVVVVTSAAGLSAACGHLGGGSEMFGPGFGVEEEEGATMEDVNKERKERGVVDLHGEVTRGDGTMLPSLRAYGRAKLCNILFARELNRRLKGRRWFVVANALHTGPIGSKPSVDGIGSMFQGVPGLPFVTTRILLPLLWRSLEEGSRLMLFAALSDSPPPMREGGQYLNGMNCPMTREASRVRMGCLERAEEKWAKRLWTVSLELLGDSPARDVVGMAP